MNQLEQYNIAQFTLYGVLGGNCADLISDYLWHKQKKSLLQQGMSEAAAELVKGMGQEDMVEFMKLQNAVKVAREEYEKLEKSPDITPEQLDTLRQKIHDAEGKLAGMVDISNQDISKILGIDKVVSDDIDFVTSKIAALRTAIFQILPQALKNDDLKIDDVAFKHQELLIEKVAKENDLYNSNFLG